MRAGRREGDVLRCHTRRAARAGADDARADRRGHRLHRDDVRGGAARGRRRDRGRAARRLRARAAAGPPRRARAGDGLLPLRLGRDRRAVGAGRARARPRRDRRLGRPPRQRDPGHRRRRPDDPLRVAAPVAVLSRHGRPGRAGRDARQPPAAGGTGDDEYLEAFETVERAVRRFEPELLLVSAASTPTSTTHSPTCELSADGFARARAAAAGLAPASPPCSRAATTSDAARPRRGGARGLFSAASRRASAGSTVRQVASGRLGRKHVRGAGRGPKGVRRLAAGMPRAPRGLGPGSPLRPAGRLALLLPPVHVDVGLCEQADDSGPPAVGRRDADAGGRDDRPERVSTTACRSRCSSSCARFSSRQYTRARPSR